MVLSGLESAVNRFLLNPANHDILVLVKALRNGVVYGTKIRFPHALVMILLFRSGGFWQKASAVLSLTKQHARSLASFVVIYKGTMILQRRLNGGKEGYMDTFKAGVAGGYLVFGRGKQSSVNQQIVAYVFCRVILGLAKLSIKKDGGWINDSNGTLATNANAWYTGLTMGFLMFLFKHHPDTLQSSLKSSMVYLYENADHWTSWKNFLWHNS